MTLDVSADLFDDGLDSVATALGRKKRVYDKPATPYQRLIAPGVLDQKARAKLAAEHANLTRAKIRRRINAIQQQLIDLAAAPT